jgi:O-antigen ligase
LTLFIGVIALFVTGARGGYISFLGSMAAYLFFWIVRGLRARTNNLGVIFGALLGMEGFAAIAVLIFSTGKGYRAVFGTHALEQSSTEARFEQWRLGWPHFLSNPLTGHGYGQSGEIIQWGAAVDSGYLTVLVETGLAGFITFAGLMLLPMIYGIRRYVVDTTEAGALAGVIAFSTLGFAINRLVLSQHENHMLFFVLIAIVIVLRSLEGYEKEGGNPASVASSPPRGKEFPGSASRAAASQTTEKAL